MLSRDIVRLKDDPVLKEASQPLWDSLSQILSSGDAAESEQVATVDLGVRFNH